MIKYTTALRLGTVDAKAILRLFKRRVALRDFESKS